VILYHWRKVFTAIPTESIIRDNQDRYYKILEYIKQNSKITIKELSGFLDLTTRAIEKQISNLKKENRVQRIGSARKDYWEIVK
jgi:ATP-dependent DNA helicase RecG